MLWLHGIKQCKAYRTDRLVLYMYQFVSWLWVITPNPTRCIYTKSSSAVLKLKSTCLPPVVTSLSQSSALELTCVIDCRKSRPFCILSPRCMSHSCWGRNSRLTVYSMVTSTLICYNSWKEAAYVEAWGHLWNNPIDWRRQWGGET